MVYCFSVSVVQPIRELNDIGFNVLSAIFWVFLKIYSSEGKKQKNNNKLDPIKSVRINH